MSSLSLSHILLSLFTNTLATGKPFNLPEIFPVLCFLPKLPWV